MGRYLAAYPGRVPVETIEEKLIPADCKCAWSFSARKLGQGGIYTLKYVNALCREHRGVKLAEPSLVP